VVEYLDIGVFWFFAPNNIYSKEINMEVQESCELTHRLRIFICPLGVGVDLGVWGAAASAVGTGAGTFN